MFVLFFYSCVRVYAEIRGKGVLFLTDPLFSLRHSRVLVTGGCGFIGSHLVRRLLGMGVERITVLDSLDYGNPANLSDVTGRIQIVKHRIGGPADEEMLPRILSGVDYLFHLAAEKHNQAIDDPLRVIQANIVGTFRLFAEAARQKIRKIVFSSSLYAYGRMKGPPMEETEVPQPGTVYGISKLTGEHFLRHVHEIHGLPFVTLRYFFVYGPQQFSGMGYKSVIIRNFERILRGENPVVFGDGEQKLDYIYVDDVVAITIRALESAHTNEIFNVGTSIPVSINQLTDKMIALSQKPLQKTYGDRDLTHGSFRVSNTTKIYKELGFQPEVTLEEGLAKTYKWMREVNP